MKQGLTQQIPVVLLISAISGTAAAVSGQRDAAADLVELEAALSDVKAEIAAVPSRDCDLPVEWDRLIGLLESNLAEVGDDSGPGADEARVLIATGIVDLAKLAQALLTYNEELCSLSAKRDEAVTRLEKAKATAIKYLGRFGVQVRGTGLPPLKSIVDDRGNWPVPAGANWRPYRIRVTKANRRADAGFIRAIAEVRDGVVTLRRTRTLLQKGNEQGWSGKLHYGAGIFTANYTTYRIWQELATTKGNFRLFVSGRRGCSGGTSWYGCWGRTYWPKVSAGRANYNLQSIYMRSLKPVIEEAVKERCTSRINGRGALEDLIFRQRPDADRSDLELFDDASEQVLSELKDSDRYKLANFIGVAVCNSIPHETRRGPARLRPSPPWSP